MSRKYAGLVVVVTLLFAFTAAGGLTYFKLGNSTDIADKTAVQVTSAATGGTTSANPLPFDMPSQASLKASNKKVYAHYFTPFPISIENKDGNITDPNNAAADYYAKNHLNPKPVSSIEFYNAAYGGLLRERALPRAPLTGNWQLEDMKTDIKRANDAGLDGFMVDVLGITGYNWDRLKLLLQAAPLVDPNFKIGLMPDSNAGATDDVTALAAAMASLANDPAVLKTDDGRLVISPFKPEGKGAAYWQQLISIMKNTYGIDVAFVPTFLNYFPNVDAFNSFSYGFSMFGGSRTPSAHTDAKAQARIDDAHARGKIYMHGVVSQDSRPNQASYYEAGNTESLRGSWSGTSTGTGAEWVQMLTWNDYTEGGQFAPSSSIGWSILDISSYNIVKYKTGQWPAVKRDALYVSHRVQPYAATPTLANTTYNGYTYNKFMSLRAESDPARDTVEVLSFLTTPGDVTVKIGANTYTYTAPAGVFAKTYPLALGQVSASMSRSGALVTDVTSKFPVVANPAVQDLHYHLASSLREGKIYTPSTNTSDINNDGVVNVFDLSILLSKWGTNSTPSDINVDGTVNVFDLSILLSKWG